MTSELEEKQQGEKPRADDNDSQDDGINDPLTRSDVEAPRTEFGSSPKPDE